MYKKTKVALKKLQKKMKKYTDRNKKETVEYKDKVLLSINYLIQQMRNKKIKKLTKKFVKLYKISKIILKIWWSWSY